MERKTKKELLTLVEEQSQNLLKYKSRLHDIVESYKNILKEKQTLEHTIQMLTEADNLPQSKDNLKSTVDETEDKTDLESKNDICLQQLRSNLGALTIEKSRIENELRTDRKRILQQKEDLEKSCVEKENNWQIRKEKFEHQILELKKRISLQQREREKEQHDHVLMLKELQNLLACERAMKERLEDQVSDLQKRFSAKVSEKMALDYEKSVDELKNKLTATQDRLQTTENEARRNIILIQKCNDETNDMKSQYLSKIDEERNRADLIEEKLKLLTFVKEKRISSLENKISELSSIVGDHDKLRQQDQFTIQKLKGRVGQLQVEYSALSQVSCEEPTLWEYGEQRTQNRPDNLNLRNHSELPYLHPEGLSKPEMHEASEKLHVHCQAEIMRLKEELEQYKIKAESALKEKYNKTSAALLSDAKSGKEIKEMKSRITQLQDQLQTCKAQLKLNEEYHNKITANLEKSSEDLKVKHKQEIAQAELTYRTQLFELEQQIQKQRERTLSLLEEKDKEIGQLKTSFLSSLIKKDTNIPNTDLLEDTLETSDQDTASCLLSNSMRSTQKEGHILHYVQELSRKDVEISSLRHTRMQTESTLRKLQQALAMVEDKYYQEVEALKSRIKLLESSQDEKGTNVEYLKNVVLRFLKCTDHNSRQHMINAISTVLHFTTSEVQDVKAYMR